MAFLFLETTMATAVKRKTKPKIEIDLAKVESLAAVGCSIEEIAASMGISARTIHNRMKEENAEIAEAITRGRAKGIASVENALYKKCIEGDVGAIKFYLCNRSPDSWSSMNKVEMTGKGGTPLQPPAITVEFIKDAD